MALSNYQLNPKEKLASAINRIRYIQFILCVVCLGLAITLAVTQPANLAIELVLLITTCMFTFITFVDLVSTCNRIPIPWNAWIVIAITGALMFTLCGGLVVFQIFNAALLVIIIVLAIFCVITAIVFLLDLFVIIKLLSRRSRATDVVPSTREGNPKLISYHDEDRSDRKIVDRKQLDSVRFITVIPAADRQSDTKSTQVTSVRSQKKPKSSNCKCGYNLSGQQSTTSYGGTFPMIKDSTPLPTPQKIQNPGGCNDFREIARNSNSRLSSYSSQLHQPRSQTYPNSPEIEQRKVQRAIRSADPKTIYSRSTLQDIPTVLTEPPPIEPQTQAPQTIYHKYQQNPCQCGQVHYQTSTTVHGSVLQSQNQNNCNLDNCRKYNSKSTTTSTSRSIPELIVSSQQDQSRKCNGLDPDPNAVSTNQIEQPRRSQLHTITEREPEWQPASKLTADNETAVVTNYPSRNFNNALSVKESKSTTREHLLLEIDSICSLNEVTNDDGDTIYSCHRKSDNDEDTPRNEESSQTSETRIVTYRQLEMIKLPGSADRSPIQEERRFQSYTKVAKLGTNNEIRVDCYCNIDGNN